MRKARRAVQLSFLAATIAGVFVVRGNAERWCPFGGVEALHTYVAEGNLICSLGVSNFYILAAVLVMALLVRRAFCGYMCPIGTISEWAHATGRRLGIRAAGISHRTDRILSLLKYPLLAVILLITWRSGELVFRGFDPCYALISRHGTDITIWTYTVAVVMLVASLPLALPFCRWLCPLAAVFHPFSRFGFARIKRDEDACTKCGHCAAACPMAIPVDEYPQVTAARCTSCMECLEVCPGRQNGVIRWGPPDRIGRHWPAAVVIAVVLVCTSAAIAATVAFPLPSFVHVRGSAPPQTATIHLKIQDLTCRGRGHLLVYFLDRDDLYAVPGYLKLEAWPSADPADARIAYEPSRTSEAAIKQAVTEPYYDSAANRWRMSPFQIPGYDPLNPR